MNEIEGVGSIAAAIVAFISFLYFIKMSKIQSGSTSLLNMMDMKNHELLTEVTIVKEKDKKLPQKEVIEIISYLNLVSKLYLNSSINSNMLRTFEGVILKIFDRECVREEYQKIYNDFKFNIKAGEPPYINLIYTRYILLSSNNLINKKVFLYNKRSKLRMNQMKSKFINNPDHVFLWKLSEKPFMPLEEIEKLH